MVEIRKAEQGDAAELVDLLRAADGAAHVSERVADVGSMLQSNPTERVFVAVLSGRLVGFASVQLTESFAYTRPTAELTNIFIMPDFRRVGVGSKLLAAIFAFSEEEQALELFARVSRSNVGAVKLYESLGLRKADHLEFRLRYY